MFDIRTICRRGRRSRDRRPP